MEFPGVSFHYYNVLEKYGSPTKHFHNVSLLNSPKLISVMAIVALMLDY